jgi:hypothetical protein
MTQPVTQESNSNKLYVVLHGLVPLVEGKDKIHAFLIEMSGHTVSLGHWLSEKPFPDTRKDPLRLTGVNSGQAGINRSLNLVVAVPDLDLEVITGNPDIHARIDFPKPDKLHSFFTADASNRLTGSQQPESQNYSAVQVFEYTVPGDSFEAVTISRKDFAVWETAGYTEMKDGTKVSVLHIYNDPASPAPNKHAVDEFLKGSAIFGVDVGLADGEPLPFPREKQPLQTNLPLGLMVEELTPLARRDHVVSHLLSPLRGGDHAPAGELVVDGVFCAAVFILIGLLGHLPHH